MDVAFFVLFFVVSAGIAGLTVYLRFAGEEVGTLHAKYASPLGEERLLRVSVRRSLSRGLPVARVTIAFTWACDSIALDARNAIRCAEMLEAAAREASA